MSNDVKVFTVQCMHMHICIYTYIHMYMYILAFILQDEATAERLNKLSLFQLTILKHALTFPAVKKVVYSTCSVHKEVRTIII